MSGFLAKDTDFAHWMLKTDALRRRLASFWTFEGRVIDRADRERKHHLAEQHLPTDSTKTGNFLVLVNTLIDTDLPIRE